jgi:hypothetical protein
MQNIIIIPHNSGSNHKLSDSPPIVNITMGIIGLIICTAFFIVVLLSYRRSIAESKDGGCKIKLEHHIMEFLMLFLVVFTALGIGLLPLLYGLQQQP